jgi:hypothetical protein
MVIQIKGCIPVCLVALLLLLSCTRSVCGQGADSRLPEQVIRKVKIKEAANVHLALSALANEYGMPIGLEVAAEGGEGPKISLDLQGRPLREVLDAITAQDPRYEWKLVDSVINVFPKEGRDEFLRDLLETRVSRFAIEKGTGLFDIRRLITEAPEVRAKLERAGISHGVGGFVTNADFAEAAPGFALDVSGLTLREILNSVIAKSKTKYWIVNRLGGEHDTSKLIINF